MKFGNFKFGRLNFPQILARNGTQIAVDNPLMFLLKLKTYLFSFVKVNFNCNILFCFILLISVNPFAESNELEKHTFAVGSEIQLANGRAFKIIHLAGEGVSGKVYKAVEVKTKQKQEVYSSEVALKFIFKNEENVFYQTLIERYKLITRIQENSSDFANILDWSQMSMYGEKVEQSMVLIEEFIEGTTLGVLPNPLLFHSFSVSEEQIKKLNLIEEFVEFSIRILIKLSELGIIYGDMSPKNVMLTLDNKFKLIDFDSFYTKDFTHHIVHTAGYSPKEITQGFSKSQPGASDLFNVSLMVAEFLIGQHPAKLYIQKRKKQLLQKMTLENAGNEFDINPSAGVLFWERISFADILQSEILFKQMVEVLLIELDIILRRISNPVARAKFIELSNFVVQTLEFKPENRGFHWKGISYSHQLKKISCEKSLEGHRF